jgi:hypothetical protein
VLGLLYLLVSIVSFYFYTCITRLCRQRPSPDTVDDVDKAKDVDDEAVEKDGDAEVVDKKKKAS